MSGITAEQYEAAVGHAPEHDDLERSNCEKAGEMGHDQCGWDHKRNLPEFIAAAYQFKELLDAGQATDLLRPGYTPDTLYDEELKATMTDNHHNSDCALHNAPAQPAGSCDCGAAEPHLVVTREAIDAAGPFLVSGQDDDEELKARNDDASL